MIQDLTKILKRLLDVQELDMKMIRLLELRQEREKEKRQIGNLRDEVQEQIAHKMQELEECGVKIRSLEAKLKDVTEQHKKLESQQSMVREVQEFNALTQEMSGLERMKASLDNQLSVLCEQKQGEENELDKVKQRLAESEVSRREIEIEIDKSIEEINAEGRLFKQERDKLVGDVEPDLFAIYERLLENKRTRVVVPISNRVCGGCHISVTIQHENMVRRGEKPVFCEHCSRIHYLSGEVQVNEANSGAPKRRRRRLSST